MITYTTNPVERLIALKFLLHFVGDEHQPLHASDNHDRGGNCVLLSLDGPHTQNLHAWWDTNVVQALGADPVQVAAMLRARITPAQRTQWQRGDASSWAPEASGVARTVAYTVGSPPGCPQDPVPVALPPGYAGRAQTAAALQLERAGVRLGAVLNGVLARVSLPPSMTAPPASSPGPVAVPFRAGVSTRTPVSLRCSAEADRRGLRGDERRRFRRACMRDGAY